MEIFIVTYSYQCYEMGVDKSEHCEEFVAIFDTFLRGLSFLRKFYNGYGDFDGNEDVERTLNVTEENGEYHTATAIRRKTFGDYVRTEQLTLCGEIVNSVSNPFEAISDLQF